MQIAMAFALIRLGNISDNRSPGTGPTPMANDKTNSRTPPTESNTTEDPETKELPATACMPIDIAMPMKLPRRRPFRPSLSIKIIAIIEPDKLTTPTDMFATSEGTPALLKTVEEK